MAQERRRYRTWLLAGTVAILGLGALGTVGVVQAEGFFNEMRGGPGFGGPMVGFMVERVLKSVEATDAQREEIRGIVDAAAVDIRAITADSDDPRERFAALLAAETIDRAAFEDLRQRLLEAGDEVSTRAMTALLDAAEILTPEQRAELAELAEHRNGFGPGFGRHFGPGRR